MTLRHALHAATVLTVAIGFVPDASAELTVPDCDTLATWAKNYDRKEEKWHPNEVDRKYWFPQVIAAPVTEKMFGKPFLAWTIDEAKSLAGTLHACEKGFAKAKRYHERNAIYEMRHVVGNSVPRYLSDAEKARTDLAEAGAALEREAPSLALLRFNAALEQLGENKQSYNAANQAASAVQGTAAAPARTLMGAVRILPKEEVRKSVQQAAAARAEAMRGSVRDALVTDMEKMPATAQGLAALAQAGSALRQTYGAALGSDNLATVEKAIVARREAIGEEIAAILVKQIGESSEGFDAFASVDQRANLGFLPQLPASAANKVLAAADARRKAVADKLFKNLQANLKALPATDESIQVIDREVLPGIRSWPASANAVKPRFETAATERRKAILDAVTRAERGSMRGRVYADASGRLKLEFVDRKRVFITQPGGQTIAGTYEEEGDSRVLVTAAPNPTMVLTREGKQLLGGPRPLRRVEAK